MVFVYVRVDAAKSPLVRPYTGPFRVLERGEKFFILDLNGKRDSVSIDRLPTNKNKITAVTSHRVIQSIRRILQCLLTRTLMLLTMTPCVGRLGKFKRTLATFVTQTEQEKRQAI